MALHSLQFLHGALPAGIQVSENMRLVREWVVRDGLQETPSSVEPVKDMIVQSHNMMGDNNNTRLDLVCQFTAEPG